MHPCAPFPIPSQQQKQHLSLDRFDEEELKEVAMALKYANV